MTDIFVCGILRFDSQQGSETLLSYDKVPVSVLDARLADMGQRLFDPPDVSGWGYGDYWIDAAKLIEREQFQKLLFRTLNKEFMAENSMKNIVNNRMLDKKVQKKIRLKLAGEAYQGAPPYRVSIKHSGGKWFSKINYLKGFPVHQ